MKQVGIKSYILFFCIMFDDILDQVFYNFFFMVESMCGYIGVLMNVVYIV